MSIKCLQVGLLKSFLGKFEHHLDNKPNGQSKYTFPSGLVINVYETGSVVFQGDDNVPFKNQVEQFINTLNQPFM